MKTDANDFRTDIGRADKGQTFVRVVHVASGRERWQVGLGRLSTQAVADQLKKELQDELSREVNLTHAHG